MPSSIRAAQRCSSNLRKRNSLKEACAFFGPLATDFGGAGSLLPIDGFLHAACGNAVGVGSENGFFDFRFLRTFGRFVAGKADLSFLRAFLPTDSRPPKHFSLNLKA